MPVPNTFGTATSAIPLSQLDANFATPITIGNTAVQLGNTVTTLNNMTLANVTISSGNVTITNVAVTTANVSGTANISTLVVVGNATVGGNTTITGNITAANANVTTNLVLSGGTANGVAYLNTSKVLTTGSALVFDGSSFLDLKTGANQRFYRSDNGRYGFIYADNNGLNIGATSANGEELRLSATGAQYFYVGATPTIAMTVASATGGVGAVGIGYTSLTSVGNNGLAVLGNVGIGTSSPASKLHVNAASGSVFAQISSGVNDLYLGYDGVSGMQTMQSDTGIFFATGASFTERARIESDGTFRVKGAGTAGSTDAFQVAGTAPADAARITSGGALLLTCTSVPSSTVSGLQLIGTGGGNISSSGSSTSTYNHWIFKNGNDTVGSISTNGSTTTYATSSDYRLKHDIAPMTGALAKVALLKPVTYKWNADGSDGEGFIAHELAEVCPQAVTGEKDAVDAEGKPQYQGIDVSFLVGTLTAAIQELKAEFDAYKASHP